MLLAMAALILWLGGYAVLCAVRPFAPCRKCGGVGEIERFGKPKMCAASATSCGCASAAACTTPGAAPAMQAPARHPRGSAVDHHLGVAGRNPRRAHRPPWPPSSPRPTPCRAGSRCLIPGALQSYAYACEAIRSTSPALPLETVGERADVRRRRIDQLGAATEFIVDEGALYRPVVDTRRSSTSWSTCSPSRRCSRA